MSAVWEFLLTVLAMEIMYNPTCYMDLNTGCIYKLHKLTPVNFRGRF